MSNKPKKLKIEIPEYNYNIPDNIVVTPIFNRQMKYSKSFEFWSDHDNNENQKILISQKKKIKIK